MPSFWDSSERDALCRRVEQLTPDAAARWGRFNATKMMAHLNDSLRMAAGDLAVAPKNLPLRYFPIKQLVIHLLPFPRGAPTAPELLTRGNSADFKAEQASFRALAARVAEKSASEPWPSHPAFGTMTHKDWGVLMWRHVNHHLRQFGV